MTEYGYEMPATIPSGRVVFRFENAGSEFHNASMFVVGDDWLPLDEQLHSDTRRPVTPFAQAFSVKPGSFNAFAVNLKAGVRYGLLCSLASRNGTPHYLQGMDAEIHPVETGSTGARS